jgi:hypothetical protein
MSNHHVVGHREQAKIEAAANHDKNAYPNECPCAVCGYRWMQHMGLLCPATPGGFIPLDGEMVPVMPVFRTDSFFIPDLAYYRQPDFDVV